MRENPWHVRLPVSEHYQWFKLLILNHELTFSWIGEVAQPLNPQLGPLISRKLEDFLDDTSPTDTLRRLEASIWSNQVQILAACFKKMMFSDEQFLDGLLSRASWHAGKEAAKVSWPGLTSLGDPLDLKAVFHAIYDTPFSGYPELDAFLIRRSLASEVQIELRKCPHHSKMTRNSIRDDSIAIEPIIDRLCRYRTQWLRGYVETLNSRVSLEYSQENHKDRQQCLLRLFLT
jgi:hypothetical protein